MGAWPKVTAGDGSAWQLPLQCSFEDYTHRLGQLKTGKAVSLDRLSVEMVRRAPEEVRWAFYDVAMRIAGPDADGGRAKPEVWQKLVVKLLHKKTRSDLVKQKRDIGILVQGQKMQSNLYFGAYEAVMPRLHSSNHGWTPARTRRSSAASPSITRTS